MKRRDFLVSAGVAGAALLGGRVLRENLMPTVKVMGSRNPYTTRIFSGCVGPRGIVGPRNSSTIPEWPGSFDTDNITDFTTLQTAVNAGGTARKFHITGSFPFTAVISPHANDGFWFDNGVTITRGAAIASAFQPSAPAVTPGVKIMNGAFDGFNLTGTYSDRVISCNQNNDWEVAYCDVTNTYVVDLNLGARNWVHHCNFHNMAGATVDSLYGVDFLVEDNKFVTYGEPGSDGGMKLIASTRSIFRHNFFDGGVRGALWFDTSNTGCLVESNEMKNCGTGSPMGTLCFEVDRWVNGTETGDDVGELIADATKNVVRYNYIHDNYDVGLNIFESPWVHAYENVFSGNARSTGSGEIYMRRDGNAITINNGHTMHYDLNNVLVHHNQITPLNSSKKAVSLVVSNTVDHSPYVNNTKDNDFDYNIYFGLSGSQFDWDGTAKTFAQWQTVAQGSAGLGAFQDIHGESR